MRNPDLINAIRDLYTAITTLTDELHQQRQAEQRDIEAIMALHKGYYIANTEAS